MPQKSIHKILNMNKKQGVPLWKRLLAFIIDMLLLNLIIVPPLEDLLPQIDSIDQLFGVMEFTPEFIGVSALIVLLNYLYWIVLEYKLGQTVGKMFLKIKVVTQGTMNIKQSILRNITKPFSIALIIDTVYMFVVKGNQRLLEKLSNTWVQYE